MIAFSCEGCGQWFRARDELAGRKSRCKQCGSINEIPAAEPILAPLVPRPEPTAEAPPRRKPKPKVRNRGTIDRDTWASVGIGAALAAVALAVPPIGFVIHVLMVVIHELGHTATAWLLASPAAPSFDLSYGGGVSLILPRQPLLVVAAYAILAYFLIRARDDRPELVRWAVAAVLYSLAIFTPLRDLLITAMGHGSELLFAGIFLYRALSGSRILRGEERPLYAALAFFILLHDGRFAANLATSTARREAYGDAKGGGHMMDFDLIADSIHWPLRNVAALFVLACVLTAGSSVAAHRFRRA